MKKEGENQEGKDFCMPLHLKRKRKKRKRDRAMGRRRRRFILKSRWISKCLCLRAIEKKAWWCGFFLIMKSYPDLQSLFLLIWFLKISNHFLPLLLLSRKVSEYIHSYTHNNNCLCDLENDSGCTYLHLPMMKVVSSFSSSSFSSPPVVQVNGWHKPFWKSLKLKPDKFNDRYF